MATPSVPHNLERCAELFAARADIEDDLVYAFDVAEDVERIGRDLQRLAILDRDIAGFLEGGGLSAPPGALTRGLLSPSREEARSRRALILPELGDVRWDRLTVKMINQFEKARYMFEAGELEQLGELLVETCETMQYAVGELHPDYTPWPFCEERKGSTERTSDGD